MDDSIFNTPKFYTEIEARTKEIGFSMPSDLYVGSLLKTLAASKPKSNLLELGTGTGLSLCWIIDGMDSKSRITTVDNDPELCEIASNYFGEDERVHIVCADGTEWLKGYRGDKYDLVFADAWPGKYSEIDLVLDFINVGGFYIIDDMQAQTDWPEGHEEKADKLIAYLESREDYHLTKMNWSTGIIVMTKKY